MTKVNVVENGSGTTRLKTRQHNYRARTAIDRIFESLSPLELPEKEHFENHLRYKRRANHKPRTIDSSFTPTFGLQQDIYMAGCLL